MTTKHVSLKHAIPSTSAAIADHNAAVVTPGSRRQPPGTRFANTSVLLPDSGIAARQCNRDITAKPFTVAELQARSYGETYLHLAQTYRDSHDTLNAVSCCLEGLALTFGISRPLAVRDQLHDLLDNLDPLGTVSSEIKLCMDSMSLERVEKCDYCNPNKTAASTNLNFLISAHQLLAYRSEYQRFNRAYEDALACLKQNPSICELYIVQYRTQLGAPRHDAELHFSFVPAAMISRNGPCYLTDICAVLRRRTLLDLSI